MNIIDKVIDAYGGINEAHKKLGYSKPMGVYNWRSRGIPKSKVAQIHLDTGIPIPELLNTNEIPTDEAV